MLMRMKGKSVSQVTSHHDPANKKQAGDARHPRVCSHQQGCVELQFSKSNDASPCACGAESSRMAMQALAVTTFDAMDLTFPAVGSFFKMVEGSSGNARSNSTFFERDGAAPNEAPREQPG